MSSETTPIIYFISGMWCSTCAKNIRESVCQLEGVDSADLNYASKLLLVRPKTSAPNASLDELIQFKVRRIGFGIKKQSKGWVLHFHERLKKESHRNIPWTLVSGVWFLAMWSSMFAFASYIGGDLTAQEHFILAIASSVVGLPAILLGIIPFARSGLRALWFSRLLTLDFFIFFGGLSATAVSILSLLSHSTMTYADSGSMVVAILLLAKKIETGILNSSSAKILFELHPKKKAVEVFKKNNWVLAEVSQVRRGDLVRIQPQETVPFDGVIESTSGEINNHLMSGEASLVQLKKGDHVFAGAIAESEILMSVEAPQGERKIDQWAETALISGTSQSKHTKLFSKIESSLVALAFCGATLIACAHLIRGADARAIVESFFVGILVFCPCLFASIIPLARQATYLALLKKGVIISRADALLDLCKIKDFYFDKTGTLQAVQSTFVSLEGDERPVEPYLLGIQEKSKHPILRGLKISGVSKSIIELNEHPGKGLTAKAEDGTDIVIGKASFLRERGIQFSTDSLYPLVSLDQQIVGEILVKEAYDEKAQHFLKKLLKLIPEANVKILSGDPSQDTATSLTNIDPKISYLGGLLPEEKAKEISGESAFIGDGLNDTLALAKAKVSFRLGHRIFGFAPVDFHLRTPDLDLILSTLRYAKKFKTILIQTAGAAFLYNVSALSLAALGKFSPLGAVLSMLASFLVMVLSVSRLHKV